jgi:auxin influx carrier (AUX1 LAX family)
VVVRFSDRDLASTAASMHRTHWLICAQVMDNPKIYDYAYALATIYVYVITLPTGITGFHTFGREAQHHANGFYMYAKSPARDIGVGLMCFHEFVAFGLFAGPLWHMWEKFLRVDKSHYLVRTASRYVVNAFMVLFAVMFPFFGVINSVRLSVEPADVAWRGGDVCSTQVLGAFTTTFGSFLIPALAWNLYYNSDERVKQMPKPIALGLNVGTVKVMNWVFILIILVLGLGMGGWASIKTMDEKVKEFELFDRCNGC